jgi:uncharacterized protein with GYD domain
MEEETRMPKFMIKAIYTPDGIKGLKKDTASGALEIRRSRLRAMGGKLDALYYALGDDNVFAIIDLPSHVHAASLGAAASASGLVETRTVSLLTVAEMDKALGEDVKYRPPGG